MTEKINPFVFKYAEIKARGGLNLTLPLQPALFADAFDAPGTLKKGEVSLDFSVGGDSVLLQGTVSAELALECSRCGDPVARAFEDSFDEVYPDTLEYIDTRELIRETLALLAPIKVLCSENCKGRCLVCGVNRNRTRCTCKAERPSPFEALKDIKLRKDVPEK